jgi:hypothetical protein
MYVASVFYVDVAKVDPVFQVFSYVCCKCFIWIFTYVCNNYTCVFKFSGFFQVFQTYVANVSTVSDICYKSFIWML